MRNVHGGCTVMRSWTRIKRTASGGRQRTTLDLGGLRERVVGILRELQQHAVGSIAVAPHQFVDPLPQERLVLRLSMSFAKRSRASLSSLERFASVGACSRFLCACSASLRASRSGSRSFTSSCRSVKGRCALMEARTGRRSAWDPFAPLRPPVVHLLAGLDRGTCDRPSLDGVAE